ncbi:MAG: ABC transporter ATP-binding protein [Deferribacteres bacterium]|nr:ABC transporter ATP-binding protein [Deferribacteres bacterium]
MCILEVQNIVAGYGRVNILHGVSISVGGTEIVTVIGPNGAGKSTLLRSVFGLITPREGRIIFNGEDITGSNPSALVAKGLAYVPQDKNVFPSLSIQENLEMGAFILKGGCRSRMEVIYELFPWMRDKRHVKAGDLSGGQQQMVALGRALMLEPRLLLLDEPSAGLAPNMVSEILEKVKQINSAGVAVLMIEQNARKALAISGRGYVLAMGRNEFEGTGSEMLNNPEIGRLYLGG